MATLILNFVFQAFQIGSNLWLTKWVNDKNVANDTGLRDMYLGVYGAFGFGQGKFVVFASFLKQQSLMPSHKSIRFKDFNVTYRFVYALVFGFYIYFY